MSEALNTLFQLDGLGFGDEGVRFEFARALPAWAWALVVLGAIGIAWWSYRGLLDRGVRRWALPALRAATLLVLILVLAGPQLVRDRERVERDWIGVVIDRSRSLSVPDAGADGPRVSRDEQLQRALDASSDTWRSLAAERELLWLGFDDAVYELPVGQDEVVPALAPAEGNATRVGMAVESAVRRLAGRPVSAIVVLSDGRSSDEPTRETQRRLLAAGVPVFTVPLGQDGPIRDASVEQVEGPSAGYLGDPVPLRVRVAWSESAQPPERVRVADAATGLTLAESAVPVVTGGDGPVREAEVSIPITPDNAGDAVWVVSIDGAEGDLIPENNNAEHRIELIDRPIRVAYFDGYPRWEQRFLKNILIRERSVDVASVILSSERQFEQDGELSLDAIPASPEEWAAFDVVVIGDLRPGLFAPRQLEMLLDHVSLRGAGLLWVAGPGATPTAWTDSALAPLLPMVATGGEPADGPPPPIVARRTESADRLGLLALDDRSENAWPAVLTDATLEWPVLRWHHRVDPDDVKPGVTVLARAQAQPAPSADDTPLVMTMRYGAGEVGFVGTDEIWRWRYGRGEDLTERFWLPVIRSLARGSAGRRGVPAVLTATPETAWPGRPVSVRVRLADQSLIDAGMDAIDIRVSPADEPRPGTSRGEPTSIRLASDQPFGTPAVSFSGVWTPDEVGRFRLEPGAGALDGLGLSVEVDVRPPDDERRRPEADHELLATLAQQTGGRVLAPSELNELASLPNRSRITFATPEITSIWDRPISLILLLSLLAVEWVWRRLGRLD